MRPCFILSDLPPTQLKTNGVVNIIFIYLSFKTEYLNSLMEILHTKNCLAALDQSTVKPQFTAPRFTAPRFAVSFNLPVLTSVPRKQA